MEFNSLAPQHLILLLLSFLITACQNGSSTAESNISADSSIVVEPQVITHTKQGLEANPDQALIDSATTLIEASRYKDALAIANEVLDGINLKGSSEDTIYAKAYNIKSNSYWRLHINDRALETVDSAYELMTSIMPNQNSLILAGCYMNYGYIWKQKSDYDLSIDYFEKAAQLYLNLRPAKHPDLASAYNGLGSSWSWKKHSKKALYYYDKVLSIYLTEYGKNDNRIASTYNNLANVYFSQYDYDLALDYYRKAADIRINNDNRYHLYTAFHLMGVARSYWKRGPYKETLKYIDEADEIFKHVTNEGDYFHDNPGSSILKGFVYRRDGDFEKAIYYLTKALKTYISNSGEKNWNVANTYLNIGIVHNVAGDYNLALEQLEKAEAIFIELYGPNDPQLAQLYKTFGIVYNLKGNAKAAINAHRKAAKLTGYNISASTNFSNITDFGTLRGIFISTRDYYNKQLEKHPEAGYLDSLKLHYEIMIALENYLQREYTVSSSRQFYASEAFSIYEGAIENIIQRNQVVELPYAFTLAEKTKSRQLNEKIQAASYASSFGLPDSLTNREYDIEIAIEAIRKDIFEEEKEKTPNESELSVLKDSLFNAKESQKLLKLYLQANYSNYYTQRYSHQVISIKGVQDSILEDDRHALIEYVVGDSSLYVFLIQKDTFNTFRIPKDFPLEQWIEDMRCGIFGTKVKDSLECPIITPIQAQQKYTHTAYQIYQKIFAPIEEFLPEQAILTIIPDGVLGYVPFEALICSIPKQKESFIKYDFLLEKYMISYAYSATLQKEMLFKKHQKNNTKPLIAFAPVFDKNTVQDSMLLVTRFIDASNYRSLAYPLKHNIPEALQIAEQNDGIAVTGTKATEAAFLENASNYKIIHLATHGKADDKKGDYSYLVFHETPEDSIENEWLYNSELYNLNLNADMVVLSACETGIGELKRGEGIISLARGFSYAGAKSIITSLWNVNDQSSRMLMVNFYKNLKRGMPKQEALRQAKLDYIRDPNLADSERAPFYWAAFIPVGDMSPLQFSNDSIWYWIIGLVAIVLLVYFSKRYF